MPTSNITGTHQVNTAEEYFAQNNFDVEEKEG